MSVGLALIVRDEADNLPGLLASVEGAFDEVVLVDTGSTDDTVVIFEEWADSERVRNEDLVTTVGRFEWIDDFAAARTYADALITSDWRVWADADDVIINAQNIRTMCERAEPGVVGYVCGYDYIQHPETGACICHLKRERVVRAGHGEWTGRVHEAQIIEGGSLQEVPDHIVQWKHRKVISEAGDVARISNDRNLRILRKWNDDEPNNPRVVGYLGTELASKGEHHEALGYYHEYLSLKTGWDEERAQIHRKVSASLLALERVDEAIECAFAALDVLPTWPDSYLSLAEGYLRQEQWVKAEHWARQAVMIGVPRTLLIINPLDYQFSARVMLAHALAGMGNHDAATTVAEEALSVFPDSALAMAVYGWKAESKREHTANTFALCCEQLIAHDEQIKARDLLRCVPHFATDHPRIVGMRTMLGERLAWLESPATFEDHYNTGGSKPEDFIPDDQVDELCGLLPRTGFLLEGVKEQIANGA